MKRLIFSLLVTTIFSSCQDVIDIDLNAKDPVLVVDGNLSDQPGPHQVILTRSVNFDESNAFPAVTNALVTLSDNTGNTELLAEVEPGVYQTSSPGIPGRIYTVQINDGGEEFISNCYMPLPVHIDTIEVDSITFAGSSNLYVRAVFQDDAATEDYYRIIQIINGDTLGTINLFSDEYINGSQIGADIFSDMSPALNYGDTVTLILHTIDEPVFRYLNELVVLINRGAQASAPANPTSNIRGGALGYFSAHAVRQKTIIVQ